MTETYGLIKWKQINRFERPAFTDFGNPDFVKYAESFGAQACRVQAAGNCSRRCNPRSIAEGDRD